MALCATPSYPNQVSTCTPDSDSNIVDPAVSPDHPGTAFVELQLYPPGWVPWPTWQVAVGASACDPTRWCAAMNIFSLAEDPVAGTLLNSTCAAGIQGRMSEGRPERYRASSCGIGGGPRWCGFRQSGRMQYTDPARNPQRSCTWW